MTLGSKIIHVVFHLIGSLPFAWVIAVFHFTYRARLFLGYWPAPSHPDPKFIPFDLHRLILSYGSCAVFWSLFIFPGLYLLFRKRMVRALWLRVRFAFALGWASILIFSFTPKINFIAWFLD